MEDNLKLGGNIELSGFRDIDPANMVVVKKIVGNYAKRIKELLPNSDILSITTKPVHSEESDMFEVHAKLIDSGRPISASVTERNLFVAIDNALKKVVNQISK